MDRHLLWRHVNHDVAEATKRAPEGYEAFVQVFLAGRDDPLEVGWVETNRSPDYPFVRFELANDVQSRTEGDLDHQDRWVHVHENHISRVEVAFRKSGTAPTIGFAHRIVDDAQPPAA